MQQSEGNERSQNFNMRSRGKEADKETDKNNDAWRALKKELGTQTPEMLGEFGFSCVKVIACNVPLGHTSFIQNILSDFIHARSCRCLKDVAQNDLYYR